MSENQLINEIRKALNDLEDNGDIVLCPSTPNLPEKKIYDAITTLIPNTPLSSVELYAVRSLILHAIRDKRFFDWEMPTLTGLNAEEFENIAKKLPRE